VAQKEVKILFRGHSTNKEFFKSPSSLHIQSLEGPSIQKIMQKVAPELLDPKNYN